MKNRNIKHSDNWATPKTLYDELDREFSFDFDPCPICEGEISPDKDGLLIDWGQRNFINPPYSRQLKEAFVRRAVEFKGKGRLCVMLLPVSTSTKLFHDVILPNADDIRFLRGRVKFGGVNTFGKRVTNKVGMHDSMIVVFDGTKKDETMNCECKTWASENLWLVTNHHPKCPKWNGEEEARAQIEALLQGIITWANDEDGIHYKCFDAFRSAAYFIGRPELVKKGRD